MKFDKPTSLATLAACAALATVFYLREPSELADNSGSEDVSGSVVDSRPSNSAPARPGPQYSTEALPVEEQAMLAELQRNFSPEELEEVFNPLTFDERRQMTFGPTDHLADAARRYERDWASFVDGLGLNASDSRFVRDAWIEARALDTELSLRVWGRFTRRQRHHRGQGRSGKSALFETFTSLDSWTNGSFPGSQRTTHNGWYCFQPSGRGSNDR